MAKSRTIARPALKHKIFMRVWSFVASAGYFFAVLVLFQFFAVQLALNIYENVDPPSLDWIVPSAEAKNMPVALQVPVPRVKSVVGLPVRLKIPSIKVNAAIRTVGLTPTGAMGVPRLAKETAWYKLGPKPGETGSAVIAGHVNWLYGAIGVFEKLNTLKPGDKITILDDKGVTTTFAVREIRTLGKKADAAAVFFSYDGKSHLNLITCGGIWDKATKAYSKRIVVFADKVGE